MKNLRKIAAPLLAVLLLAALPFCARAKAWETEDFTAQVPEGFYQFGLETSLDDPAWALIGVGDPTSKLKEYADMNAIANFVSEEGDLSILVMKKESDYSKQVFSLAELSQEERQKVLENLSQGGNTNFTVNSGYYDGEAQVPFFRIQVDGEVEGATQHELLYGTIVNGISFTFDIYGGEKEIPKEHVELLEGIISSVRFREILPMPDTTLTTADIVRFVGLLVLLVAAIAAPFIMIPLKNRAEKRRKAKLAQQLEEYRKLHGTDTVEGEMKFSNATDCTKEAIRTFSLFHAYVKNLPSLLFGGLSSIVVVALVFGMDADLWMKLLAVALVVYYGYKVATTPTNIEKVQRKVYNRGPSSTAVYAFYEDAFRVSGVQSASVYPYLQITDVKKHNHYLYLYYGPDNAYLVDRYGFHVGEYEDFVKFISEKTGKKL